MTFDVHSFSRRALSVSALSLATAALAEIPKPTDAPQPLTPEQSAAAFRLPEGFRMEVVASEPLIASPSAVCWDERGRMFVSELHGYNLEGQLDIEELNKSGQLDTQVRRVQADERFKKAAERGTFGVVKVLRDTDGDGRMDKAETWANDLPPAYGLVPARGGVIVACAPDIVLFADRDGDGTAEVRETLFTGFKTGALERGINAPQWGADGWLYFGRGWGGSKVTGPKLSQSVALPDTDFRIRSDGTAIEPVTGGTHTFGFAMTASGDRFVVTTTTPAIYVAPLPWRYLVRNPDAATRGLEQASGDRCAWSLSRPHPWRQRRADDPAYFKFYRDRYGAAESEAGGWFTAACGPLVYLDRALPGLHGQYFVCEPSGNLIHRAIIDADGATLNVRRAPNEERSEFAATTDAWSHPMNLTHGPDGALWITDYYREIIEDYSAIPRHLQQQYGVYAGHDRGRIYRLTHRDLPPAPPGDMSKLNAAALAGETASPLLWRRQTAQRLLVEREERSAAPLLGVLLGTAGTEPLALITVLRTLDGLGLLTPGDTRPYFTHADAAVRVHALQLADRFLAGDTATLDAVLAAAAAETNPRVLLQFAMSFGESRDPRAFAALVRLARTHGGIRWMDAALLSSLHARGGEMLSELVHEAGAAAPLFEPLAKAIAARADEAELALALTLAAAAPADVKPKLTAALATVRKRTARKPDIVPPASTPAAAPAMEVSDETFRKFVAALSGPRDVKRGHEVFSQSCALCHRIGNEGHVFGPDLLGELGVPEETLVRHLLLPNERIRPGYETTLVDLRDGTTAAGIVKEDGATSLTLVAPGGTEQSLLRKDIAAARRTTFSLMPSFVQALTPADIASLLGWLRSRLVVTTAVSTAAGKPSPPAQPASGHGGSDYRHKTVRELKHGMGGTGYHLFEPAEPAPATAPVIVFLHGWGAMDPWVYGAWIQHLVRRGNIIIYCRYQESVLTLSPLFTPNCVSSVKAALRELARPGHVQPDARRFAIAGHSCGGLLTANLAAVCAENGLPEPRALFSVQPGRSIRSGRGIGVPMANLSKLPKDALLLCITGERDPICGDADARLILAESTAIPASRKNLIVLTADDHGRPAMTGSHLAPNSIPADAPGAPVATGRLKRPSAAVLFAALRGDLEPARAWLSTPEGRQWRASELHRTGLGEAFEFPNAQDFALWRLFDNLREAAFSGRITVDAMGMSPRSLSMGTWSDGTPVKPMSLAPRR